MSSPVQHGARAHPSPFKYVAIALILAVVTAIEVAIVYQDFLKDILVLVLVILSVAKFAVVAMFYMHLRFDNRLFSILFVTGLLLATAVSVTLLALFRVIIG